MATSAKNAIKNFNVKLLQKLPLDDAIFFGMVKQANLFPLDSADSISKKLTRAEKVSHFLQYVVEPGAEYYLPELLEIMKDSGVADVIELANEIHAAIKPGIYIHISNSVVYACSWYIILSNDHCYVTA